MAMIILEMDPGIIVTIVNNEEGLAGASRAELLTRSEAAPGCPASVNPGVTLMLNTG